MVLFETGEGGPEEGRKGFSREAVARVLAAGGELSEAQLRMCKARYFVDGLVIGTEGFLEMVFAFSRGYFGAARKSGARRLRGVKTASSSTV